jgi:hypothetical protein
VIYNYAASEFQQGNHPATKQILAWLSPTEIQSQGPARAEVVFQLAAQNASAVGDHASSCFRHGLATPIADYRQQKIHAASGSGSSTWRKSKIATQFTGSAVAGQRTF